MFNQPDFGDYYRSVIDRIKQEILREPDAQIIGSETEELANFYYEKYALKAVQFDPLGEIMDRVNKSDEAIERYGAITGWTSHAQRLVNMDMNVADLTFIGGDSAEVSLFGSQKQDNTIIAYCYEGIEFSDYLELADGQYSVHATLSKPIFFSLCIYK